MRDRGDAVDDAGSGKRAERIEGRVGKVDPADGLDDEKGSGDADREPDRHLDRELTDDDPERRIGMRGELEHPDHERDPDRIVDAGLPLETRPRPTADLALAEHREHHGRIGRG